MKNQLFFYFLCMLASLSWSQQEVQYTQYMYNMSVVNPAYVTDNPGVLNLGLIYRQQWVGIDGAPASGSFFAHTPLGNNIEVGLTLQTDQIGNVIKEHNFNVDFAYKIDLSYTSKLSFGLKAGVNLFNTDFSGFNLQSGQFSSDPSFSENINNNFINIGAGAFYFSDNFYVGLSVPNLINTKYLSKTNGLYEIEEERHYFFTTGYVFEVNEMLRLKPSILTKAVVGAPLIVDMNVNALYNDRVEFGLGYRLNDAFIAMFNIKVNDKLRIGYSYDYTSTNLNTFSNGSHELFLIYDLNVFSKGFNKSPRFF
ncbi:type IX secretion system membrane protein PorP/SprF [uncultured Polaribacter sp.]|uniref:PorP/SprF family type IX secretion system membrane protein n=1 Tax=uncultured Polaribacter sp. TaxID=174711 RepID=UPI00261DB964|nr:type IX secretion system membrane protein PorP/SprF [uncultured Polaribacter sp.]